MFGRNKVAMVVAEFLGTFSLVCAMYAMLIRGAFSFFVAAAAAATLGLMSLAIGSTSGAHLNPALTLSLWTRRKIGATVGIVYIAAQMLGGVVAWAIIEYLLNTPLKSIASGGFITRVFVAEALGAFVFAFGFASALYQGFKGLRYAAVTGGALFLGILIASFGSNGLINPAVALGIKSWSLAYSVGPLLGALLGANTYAWIFAIDSDSSKMLARTSPSRTPARLTKKAASVRKAPRKR